MSKLIVFDTSLRDGEQSPGVSLTANQKVELAKAISRLGVNVCEIGFPACAVDLEAVLRIVEEVGNLSDGRKDQKPMTLAVLARCIKSDIDKAWEVVRNAASPRIHVFYGTSDVHLEFKLKKTKEEALKAIAEHVKYAKALCEDIEFSAEDAVRTNFEFLVKVCETAIANGATTINIPDTVGYALPQEYNKLVSNLISSTKGGQSVIWSTHCHNDLGLATANTLAGVKAGARQVEVTVNGIGERAGNTALEEVIMTIQTHPTEFEGIHHTINTELLVPTSKLVVKLSGMEIQKNKAIVGKNAFLHESGVHVDGFLKNRETYEILHPSSVGWTDEELSAGIVLGKHSGRAAYMNVMKSLGMLFDSEKSLQSAFERFQALIKSNPNPNQQEIAKTGIEAPNESYFSRETGQSIIVELIGDGVSSEITCEARKILEVVSELNSKRKFRFVQRLIGGKSIEHFGEAITADTIAACKAADAVLLGAVGDPKYDNPELKVRPEQGLLKIRSELGLFQNLRPVTVPDFMAESSPLRTEIVNGTDFIIVRELTGGIYNHSHEINEERNYAQDVMFYSKMEIERIVRAAADIAMTRPKKKLTSIHKANVLACSQYWKRIITDIISKEYPELSLEHCLVDSAAIHLLKRPTDFDVIVTPNLFGDILSDEAAALTCSLGMLPSASLGVKGSPGLYEPVHGSAPDIAGKGVANPVGAILSAALLLRHSLDMPVEAKAVEDAVYSALKLGFVTKDIAKPGQKSYSTAEVGEKIAAILKENLEKNRRPMNLTEKILCHQAVGLDKPEVRPGDVIVVKVSRTLASEMTWVSMENTYAALGKPNLWRKDRFWLAIDHTVDPSNYNDPKRQNYINTASSFAKDVNLDDFFGPNETILHTEFYRQRAMPGTVIIGADSHSCSAGCLGAFATGMGAADVLMPVLTGQTWIKVPETILIELKGDLTFGLTGKDVMLWILKELKRNSVALDRSVEFSGNIKALSVDGRFAIGNMITEFGGIAGIFPSDEITAGFLSKRINRNDQSDEECLNFRADPEAEYAGKYVIDLSEIIPSVAVYPEPDNVFPIDSDVFDSDIPEVGKPIRRLDGCFIGACTTTEEELILGALVLMKGLESGLVPVKSGLRKVTPGSKQIVQKLEETGLADVYRKAGFIIGAPGCSYCLAVSADVAAAGEVWLSSQNRNFRNRMGKGSFGNLASAATVAASSFKMEITDPRPLLAKISRSELQNYLQLVEVVDPVEIHEPHPDMSAVPSSALVQTSEDVSGSSSMPFQFPLIRGGIQRFGDNVDTDAIIPAQHMLVRPIKKLGQHTFQHVRPEFVQRVSEGFNIIVAGVGFGCGSSREEAVLSMVGCGVQAVIAKSFSFIYGRNLLCLNLIGINIQDDEFYELAQEGCSISIDLNECSVSVGSPSRKFPFVLTDIQKEIYRNGGIIEMYKHSGPNIFKNLAAHARKREISQSSSGGCGGSGGCGSKTPNSVISW